MIVDGRDFGGIGLGTAQFAFKDVDERQAVETIQAGVADGIRLIDTALAYNRPGSVSYAEHVVRLALAELRAEGKVKWIGVSNVSLEQLREAASITSITSVQNEFSFHHRDDPRIIDYCRDHGMAYLAYAPLGGPDLSVGQVSDARAEIARERGVSWQRVTLAWLRALDPCILPLVGSSRAKTIRDSAAELRLGASELLRLNAEER
jgi:aryl-alcohol dehydrogenase-like predicted oxidoreductase